MYKSQFTRFVPFMSQVELNYNLAFTFSGVMHMFAGDMSQVVDL